MTNADRFMFDKVLDAVLRDDPVPELPAGFADRIVAATEGWPEPLPRSRANPSRLNRWRSGQRLVLGAVAAIALGSTAAATGLLNDLPINIPTAQEVWSNITGENPANSSTPQPVPASSPALIQETHEPVVLEGPIDTPEELEEVFRRVDQVREGRRSIRRENADQRLDDRIERRRELGLPGPTPEQEERLRGRIERFRENADERIELTLEERRDQLRQDVENGAELSPQEVICRQHGLGTDTPNADRYERFRQLSPAERRERIRQFRERRQDRFTRDQTEPAAVGEPLVEDAPADVATERAATDMR